MSEEDGRKASNSQATSNSGEREAPFKPAAPPSLDLPKAGGALRGLGEKFQAGGPTGTGSLRVPIPVSACRGGAEPALALTYDSGQGQGPFGIGWSVAIPSITRRTDKGIPLYADEEESDIFILAGQEDLVPVLTCQPDGSWKHVSTQDGNYRVDAYRPRVEGLFARVERLTNAATGETFWRSITSDNVTSVFGLSSGARLADPDNSLHVFKWMLEATFDSLGHATLYEYKQEDLAGVAVNDVSEASRIGSTQSNIYPKRVHYGNQSPLMTRNPAYSDLTALTWYFEVVFDYGEHTADTRLETIPWAIRQDSFSSCRSGFEIRTYRLCQRVLMFHEILNRLGTPVLLVKSTEFGYDQSPTVTYLTSVRGVGYMTDAESNVTEAFTPTLQLDYTRVNSLSTTVQTVDEASLAQAPGGIDGQNYQFIDLDGEGISGILTAAASPAPGLYYKRNLGSGDFGPGELLPAQPSFQAIAGDVRLMSLNSDGRLDVAQLSGPVPGFFERTRSFSWSPFATFQSLPRVDWNARGVHLLDVDGDGLTDILVAEDDVFVWYASLSRQGFGPPNRVTQSHDEERGAVVLMTDDYETIFLADMNGDGLSDLVRIRNGDICYWPNLGYGRFGRKITMKTAPAFDNADLFDPRRIRLADIDGTGVSDIVYLSRRGAAVYFNQAGNGWAAATTIPIPTADTMASVRVADFLGTGTSCIVWSSVNPLFARTSLRYVDLLSSVKPHLLNSIINGLGSETAITYAPSTQYYLEDREAGHPWATRLPFVVQTVAQVQTNDLVARSQIAFRFRYAHGFFDGVEREFRGFARVDSWDADSMSSDHGAGVAPGSIDVSDGQYDLPPVHTITWFHTGAWNGERDDLRVALSAEFFSGDPSAGFLPPTAIPAGLLPPALREAYRALKGKPLRQEIYSKDGAATENVPYSVTEYRYEVRELQPIDGERHGVYHPFDREQIVYHYERNSDDPRVEHQFSLQVDPLGHVVRDAHVAYARRTAAQPEQGQVLASCGTTTYAAPFLAAYDYRHGVVTEALRYELPLAPTSAALSLSTLDTAMTSPTVIAFDKTAAIGQMRMIEHVQHQFWADDLSGALAIGQVQARALVYDHFALAIPSTLLNTVFGTAVSAAELIAAGYVSPDGDFWTHAGTTSYDGTHFYEAIQFTDPFGNTSRVCYDAERLFVIEEHTSANAAFDNVTKATMDYRVLQPALIIDPNGNQTAAAFDELGMPVALAVMGQAGAGQGDTLADPTTKIDYDLLAWETSNSPAYIHIYARQQHGAANPGWFETVSYSDGSGHEVLKKAKAEPDSSGNARWVGTGRTVFDNKGNPIKKYEPYFADDSSYDDEDSLVATGYTDILRYDPLSRLIRVDHSNGTFETTEFDAWQESISDANDNVLESAWYADKNSRPSTDPLYRAAALAAEDADTPAVNVVDPLGRKFLSIADNGDEGQYQTRTQLDIQGNALAITDAIGNVTLRQVFDVLGRVLQHASVDAGTSLAIADGAGHPHRSWDARGFTQRKVYDALQRPTQVFVTPPGGNEFLAEQVVYGEGLALPNFRGHLYQCFDGAGVATNVAYDLENRVTHGTRQLAAFFQATSNQPTPSWAPLAALTDPSAFLPAAQAAGLLEMDVFDTWTAYDAMSRIMSVTTHDQTAVIFAYNEASLVGSITAFLRGSQSATSIVSEIDYNARGQRIKVVSGENITTHYTYDHRTRMIMRIQTASPGGSSLQDLNYTYDPAHNIVQITDRSQQTNYFAGNVTSGTQLFQYDAIYRLTQAQGREQPGQVGYALGPNGYPETPLTSLPHRNDLQALLAYTEKYYYDYVGNLLQTVHNAANTTWTRTQTYVAGGNRLSTESMPGDAAGGPYSGIHKHDNAGNMILMPHLSNIGWDQNNRMTSAVLSGGGTAYFTYDRHGQRVRKMIVQGGNILESIYIGSYECYREYGGTTLPGAAVNIERETVHIYDAQRRFVMVETQNTPAPASGQPPTPQQRFQFPNHLGSACLETDETGSPITYEEYYPFGGSSFRAGDVGKRYRFSAKERDEKTGLYYFGARYYAPWLGRWISCDPLGFVDGSNLFAYCQNNPICRSDTFGGQSGAQTDPKYSSLVTGTNPQVSPKDPYAPGNPTLTALFDPSGESGKRLNRTKNMVEIAQGVSNASLAIVGFGEIASMLGLGRLLALLPHGVQVFLGVALGVAGAAAAGISLGEGLTGESIFGRKLTLNEQTEALIFGAFGVGSLGAAALESGAFRLNLNRFTTGAVDNVLKPQAGDSTAPDEEETVSLFHGSWKNVSDIRESGFTFSKGTANVSTDIRAAEDAVSSRRLDVEGVKLDPALTGIIESRMPETKFNELMMNTEGVKLKTYPGFHGANLNSTEILLQSQEAMDLFNRYIIK